MFKEKLKLLREEHHLSQVELANKIYVSRSAVAKWEQGRGMPNSASLQELCKLFNLTEKELLNEKEQYIYTFDYKKEKINIVIMDHNFGNVSYYNSHLNEKLFIEQINKLTHEHKYSELYYFVLIYYSFIIFI